MWIVVAAGVDRGGYVRGSDLGYSESNITRSMCE